MFKGQIKVWLEVDAARKGSCWFIVRDGDGKYYDLRADKFERYAVVNENPFRSMISAEHGYDCVFDQFGGFPDHMEIRCDVGALHPDCVAALAISQVGDIF